MLVVSSLSSLRPKVDSKTILLCDENTALHCAPLLGSGLNMITIPAGEEHKNLETCKKVWDDLIDLEADRSTELWCLGGGMVCDLGGFAASCYLRGISFKLIPTSLLAMVDAANGGKSGVDYHDLKNYIGAFTQPDEIILHTEFLQTLPAKEWINGKMEMLKHGLICSAEHFEDLKGSGPNDVSMIQTDLILRSVEIKEKHCSEDRFEQGIRKRLNFGHTIGHAIESLALSKNDPIPHGLAVGIGMIAESYLSYTDWSLSSAELDTIVQYLHPLLAEVNDDLLNVEDLLPLILKDKKNRDRRVYFSLLSAIGNSQENIMIESEKIAESIEFVRTQK